MHALEEFRRRELREDVVGKTTGEGVAAKRGSVVAELDLLADGLGDQDGADGEAVAEGLGRGQDIGMGLLGQIAVGPELAGARHAGLDLVVDQDSANLAASLGEGDHKLLAAGKDASLALDRLDNDTAGLVVDKVVDSSNIVVSPLLEARHHRRKWLLVLGIMRRRQRSHRTAVESVLERDNVDLFARRIDNLACLAGELDGSLVGLGAGVADEDTRGLVHASCLERLFDEQLGQRAGPGVVVQVRGVDQRAGLCSSSHVSLSAQHKGPSLLSDDATNLLRNNIRKLGVAVAQPRHSNSGREIKVLSVLNIPEPRALALDKHRRRASIGSDHVRRIVVDKGRARRIGRRIGIRQSCISLQLR